jgi:hypothetical protein
MIAQSPNTDTTILSRLIDATDAEISPDAARFFLSLRFSEEDVERMNELSAKANEGTLTAEEDAEMTDYERVGHLLGILQSKSRRSLKRATGN